MSLRTDKVQLEIIIKGDKTRQELSQLEAKSKQLAKELKKLPEGSDEFVRKSAEYKQVQARMDQLKNSIGLTGMTMRELRERQRELNMVMQRMDPRLPEYKKLQGELAQVNNRMKELRGQSVQTSSSISKLAGGFNKYFTMFAAFTAGATGVIFTMRKMVQSFADFDDKVADVMKVTNLAKNEVMALNEEFKKMDTRTSQNELLDLAWVGGKLGLSAKEDIMGFVNAADKINVALKKDLGGNTETALREIGKLVDVFKIKDEFGIEQSMLKVASAINELGMASTAAEDFLVNFSKRAAGIAPLAGVSIPNILGLGATLDQLGQQAESSSTVYTMVMTKMASKTKEFAKIAGIDVKEFAKLVKEDANEAMLLLLENLSGNTAGIEKLVENLGDIGLEGRRSTAVLGVLANNTETLRNQQLIANEAFDDGTSVINEFNIKNETAGANLEKLRKHVQIVSIQLGEKLAPSMMFSINAARMFIKTLFELPNIIRENRTLFIALGTVLLAYNAAKIQSILISLRNQITMKTGLGLRLSEYVLTQKMLYQENLANLSKLKLAASNNILIQSYIRLRAVMAMNPFGAAIIAIGALTAGIVYLHYRMKDVNAETAALINTKNILAKASIEAEVQFYKEELRLGKLLEVARDVNKSNEERAKAIQIINENYNNLLENISLEQINTQIATDRINEYVEARKNSIKVQIIEEELQNELRKLREIENSSNIDNTKWYQNLFIAMTSSRNLELDMARRTAKGAENKNNALERQTAIVQSLEKEISNLLSTTDEINDKTPLTLIDDTETESIDSTDEKLKERVNKYIETENLLNESYLRDLQKFTDALNSKKITQIEYIDEILKLNKSYWENLEKIQQASRFFDDSEPEFFVKKLTTKEITDINSKKSASGDLSKDEVMKAHQETLKILADEKKARLDIINTIMNAENRSYTEKQDALQRHFESGRITEEEYNEAILEMKIQYFEKIEEKTRQHIAKISNIQNQVFSLINDLSDIQYNKDITQINTKYDQEEERLLRLYNNKQISEKEYQKRKETLDKERNLAEKKIAVEKTKREAASRKGEVLITGAMSAFQIGATMATQIASQNYVAAALSGVQLGLVIAGIATSIKKIESEKQKTISEFATGRYPLLGESGKTWNVTYGGKMKTGFVSTPTHFNDAKGRNLIAGEAGEEMIIDYPTLKNIRLKAPDIIPLIHSMRVSEKATGQYPSESTRQTSTAIPVMNDSLMIEMIALLQNIDSKLANTYTFKDLYDKLEEVDKQYENIKKNFTAS